MKPHHLATVRRFSPGDRITLFNGDGSEYPAEIMTVGKKSVIVNVLSCLTPQCELGFPLIVSSALPKGDRADFLIEKLTELGATRFIPLITERTIARPKETVVAKFKRAVIEASKQCGRNTLMAIDAPMSWTDLLTRPDLPANRYVLHTDPVASTRAQSHPGVIAAIGPEGGFTIGELEQARDAGWQFLSLGPRTLRVETAALAAATFLGLGEQDTGEKMR